MKCFAICLISLVPISGGALTVRAAETTETAVEIKLSEGREVKKTFIQANLLASVRGPDLKRLNSDLDNSISKIKNYKFKSSDTGIIYGNRNASVTSSGVEAGASGLFWTLQQQILIQGIDQDDVLSAIEAPAAGIEISSITYSVPIDLQKRTESEVTELAIKDVISRAGLIMKSLDGSAIRIANIRISTRIDADLKYQPPNPNPNGEGADGSGRATNMAVVPVSVTGSNNTVQGSQPIPPTTALVTADVVADVIISK